MRGIIQIPLLIILIFIGLGITSGGGYLAVKEFTNSKNEPRNIPDSVLDNEDLRAEFDALKKELEQERKARLNQNSASIITKKQNSPNVTVEDISVGATEQKNKDENKTFTLSNGLIVDEFGNILNKPSENENESAKKLSTTDIAKKSSNSIVLIQTSKGHGSGFVFDQGKYILTNAHVVGNTNIVDLTLNGNVYKGTVLGIDGNLDLAVISVDSVNFPNLKLADSNLVAPGDEVVALGFPLYISPVVTVTKGIISAVYSDAIQTDAAIHGGNSGGPLVNQNGEVIGINTFRLSRGGESGLNFAIPSNVIKSVTAKLLAGQKSGITEVYNISNPPTQGTTIDINESMISGIGLNPELTCAELFNISSERILCEWYTSYYTNYNWNIVNGS